MGSSKGYHLWLLRSKKKGRTIFGNQAWLYFAARCSLKNPRYMTEFHSSAKLFSTRIEAEEYYLAKARILGKIENVDFIRRKIFVKDGYYDYFKNAEVLRR